MIHSLPLNTCVHELYLQHTYTYSRTRNISTVRLQCNGSKYRGCRRCSLTDTSNQQKVYHFKTLVFSPLTSFSHAEPPFHLLSSLLICKPQVGCCRLLLNCEPCFDNTRFLLKVILVIFNITLNLFITTSYICHSTRLHQDSPRLEIVLEQTCQHYLHLLKSMYQLFVTPCQYLAECSIFS